MDKPEIELLDIKNIFEIERIRELLKKEPDLLSLFEVLIIITNNRINDEKPTINKKNARNLNGGDDD
tara:strand:- start:1535 stop:1735 length:201 start_codon:yes stop_codon:yes gene_type:complete